MNSAVVMLHVLILCRIYFYFLDQGNLRADFKMLIQHLCSFCYRTIIQSLKYKNDLDRFINQVFEVCLVWAVWSVRQPQITATDEKEVKTGTGISEVPLQGFKDWDTLMIINMGFPIPGVTMRGSRGNTHLSRSLLYIYTHTHFFSDFVQSERFTD